ALAMATAWGRRSPYALDAARSFAATGVRATCRNGPNGDRLLASLKRAQHGPPPQPLPGLTPRPGAPAPGARALLTRRRAVLLVPERQHGGAARGAVGGDEAALEGEDAGGEGAAAPGEQLAGDVVKERAHGPAGGTARTRRSRRAGRGARRA